MIILQMFQVPTHVPYIYSLDGHDKYHIYNALYKKSFWIF